MLKYGRDLSIELIIQTKASVNDKIRIGIITRQGSSTFEQTTVSTNEITETVTKLDDFPILASIIDDNNSIEQGSVYAAILIRVNGRGIYTLTQGLVYRGKGLSWPVAITENTVPDNGDITELTSSNPAAGAEISFTVPDNRVIKLLGVGFTLVAAAAAASRRVHLQITFPGGGLLDFFSNVDQIISETKNYTCAAVPGLLAQSAGSSIIIPIPDGLLLTQGAIISTDTDNINAGDNFSAASIECIQYLGRITP